MPPGTNNDNFLSYSIRFLVLVAKHGLPKYRGAVVDAILGYDFFVSYTWADGSKRGSGDSESNRTAGEAFSQFRRETVGLAEGRP